MFCQEKSLGIPAPHLSVYQMEAVAFPPGEQSRRLLVRGGVGTLTKSFSCSEQFLL